MKMELTDAPIAGIFVEIQDDAGNTVAQAVFHDYQGRPLPAVGDVVCCHAAEPTGGAGRKMHGCVQSRQFDVQTDHDGQAMVWVYLLLEQVHPGVFSGSRVPEFSHN